MPDQRSMRDKVLECVDDMEAIIMQITVKMVVGKQADAATQESLTSLSELFNKKYEECLKLVEEVPEHQEREVEIRQLEERVEKRNDVVVKLAEELKFAVTTLQQATYEAEKKLRSIRQSETNRVYSEEVIRLAHQLSKSYSVLSPNDWQQGDPGRPFPTEASFAVSQLMRSQMSGPSGSGVGSSSSAIPSSSTTTQSSAFPIRQQPSSSGSGSSPAGAALSRTTSNNSRLSPMAAGSSIPFPCSSQQSQKPIGMFNNSNIASVDGNSPRAHPLSSGQLGGPSPSSHPINPSILQWRPSQSPRIPNANLGSISMGLDDKQQSPSDENAGSGGGFMYSGNTASTSGVATGAISALSSTFATLSGSDNSEMMDAAPVEQMTSDSSSSSSSGDEISRDK